MRRRQIYSRVPGKGNTAYIYSRWAADLVSRMLLVNEIGKAERTAGTVIIAAVAAVLYLFFGLAFSQ